MKKHTAHWVELAKYDLKTAEHMLKSRRYVYVIFLSHLTLEKMLKACITEFTDKFPPKIHDLEKLAQLAEIQFPIEMETFVLEMSAKSVPTRYPEDLKEYNRQKRKSVLTTRERLPNG